MIVVANSAVRGSLAFIANFLQTPSYAACMACKSARSNRPGSSLENGIAEFLGNDWRRAESDSYANAVQEMWEPGRAGNGNTSTRNAGRHAHFPLPGIPP